ncbi:MAG: OmpA family protein [Lentisphaeria bacterium]|nr:OmpA family protein [Lentisphaeria bacterium]
MKTYTTIVAIAVLLAFTCAGLGWWAYELNQRLTALNDTIARLETDLTASQEREKSLRSDLAVTAETGERLAESLRDAKTQAEKLKAEKLAIEQASHTFEEKMNAAMAEQEVTISRLQGKLSINILDRIMFDSGQADLKEEGQALLVKMADVLKTVPDRQILVIGHTDNVPVTASRHRFATNWELSAARATAAVRFLVDSGVSPRNLGALGYGEHHPIADNTTAEGRAQNRRIEVVILENDLLKMN